MVIRGNWRSAAYIPALPLTDDATNVMLQGNNEIVYTGGEPTAYAPLSSGMALDDDDGNTNSIVRFDMRYFLDPNLNGSTELVVWLGRNCRGGADGCDRRNIPVTTFDTDRLSRGRSHESEQDTQRDRSFDLGTAQQCQFRLCAGADARSVGQ